MKAGGQVGKKITNGCVVVDLDGIPAIRELETDHEFCEYCGLRKTVYSYLAEPGSPIVCNMSCLKKALYKRAGGVRKPSRIQLREYMDRRAARRADAKKRARANKRKAG